MKLNTHSVEPNAAGQADAMLADALATGRAAASRAAGHVRRAIPDSLDGDVSP